ADQRGCLSGRLRPAVQVLLQAAVLEQFHGEIGTPQVLADLVDLHDVGVPLPRRRLGLDMEAGPFLGSGQGAVSYKLEGDQSLQTDLPCPVDDAHAASA